jgi:4-hydroxy-tetrahydrodipicolinate synthase
MSGKGPFQARGVMPACLLPMMEDFSIDTTSLAKHARDVAGVPGVQGIVINAHASEVSSCTFEEQERILAATVDAVGDRTHVIQGVYPEGSLEAARVAKMARRGGASALLVFPPGIFSGGANLRPDVVLNHYRYIAEASDLPLIIFQFRVADLGHSHEVLHRLVDEIPTICGIKDVSDHPVFLEKTVRELQQGPRRITVFTAHNPWLLPSLVTGCDGIISGSGSTIADLQVALFDAVQANDLEAARRHADRLYVTSGIFYTPPRIDQHNRMKEAQVALGRLPRAVVRPPLLKLTPAEIDRIRTGLEVAGIRPEGAFVTHDRKTGRKLDA